MGEARIALLRPDGLVRSPAFSHVAVIPPGATTILVGGQNAVDADGRLVGGNDVAQQTAQVLTNLETALAAAGASLRDVVQLRIAVLEGVDMRAGFEEFARRWDPQMPPPLVSAVVAGLAVPGALMEIDAVAAILEAGEAPVSGAEVPAGE